VQNDELRWVIDQYSSLLYRICFPILKNEQDTKDVLQETFLTYYTKSPVFSGENHRKAWLIRISQNKCREFLRFHKRHACLPLDEMEEKLLIADGFGRNERDLLALVWELDYKLKSVVILYYIEGYSTEEVAGLLKISTAAVRKRLQRARETLKKEYEGELVYESK